MVKLFLAVMIFFLFGFLPTSANAQSSVSDEESCPLMVIGFVGGMRSPDDKQQGVVQIGNRLRNLNQPMLQVKIFRHWFWRSAYNFIYQSLDRNHDKKLSQEEIALAPKIVVYGHSLGGWAVIKLTRKLEKIGVPVELTVQIDTVGIGDEVVPANVKSAANFYQRSLWLLRGEKKIRSADEKNTTIVGNFLIHHTGHEALAREALISDFITTKVRSQCVAPVPLQVSSAYR